MDCLVTKLKGTVNDDSLLKLGELRITLPYLGKVQNLILSNDKGAVSAKIISGGALLCDMEGQNGVTSKDNINGETFVKTNEGETSIMSIADKYSLTDLSLGGYKDVEYRGIKIEGGLSALRHCTKLKSLNVASSALTDDFSSLALLKDSLKSFVAENTVVTGNISLFENFKKLTALLLGSSRYSGTINLDNLPNLQSIGLEQNSNAIPAPFDALAGKDWAQFSFGGNYTYETKDFSLRTYGVDGESCHIGSAFNLTITNLDGFLNDISKASFRGVSINLKVAHGDRTSASDTAISTLQGKNVTVTVPVATDARTISTMSLDSGNYGIAYKDKELIVEPVDLTKMQIHPASGVTVKTFDTKENAEKFIEDNGLVRV